MKTLFINFVVGMVATTFLGQKDFGFLTSYLMISILILKRKTLISVIGKYNQLPIKIEGV